jgi:hypothetical protein
MKVFKEQQRFTQTWLVFLLIVSTLIPFGIVINEFVKNESTMKIETLFWVMGLMLVFTIPIFFFRLITRIDEKGIHYQFLPFHFSLKTIRWNEITKAYVRVYDPIGDYGGWGLKGGALWNRKNGKAINVSGDVGIQLELTNGKKLLIGTQKKDEATRVLETYKHKILQDG